MDFEEAAARIAGFVVAAGDAGAEPTWIVPPRLRSRPEHDRPLTVHDLHAVKSAMEEGGDEGEPMQRWVRNVLRRVTGVPLGVDGEPITWAEACDRDHPLHVASKAFTDPRYMHLRDEARRYVGGSPLRGFLPGIEAHVGESICVKAAENHTGALVALVPSEEWRVELAKYGTENANELHVTLHYPGQVADLEADGLDKLLPRMRAVAHGMSPIDARIAGQAMFNPAGEAPAHVLILNHDGIGNCQREIAEIVETTLSGELVDQHQPYIPHITLSYGTKPPLVPNHVFEREVRLDALRVSWGQADIDIPLGGDRR